MHAAEQMLVLDKFNQFTFYGYFCDFPIKSGLLGFGLIGSKGSKPFFFAHISYIIGPFWGSSLQVKNKKNVLI